MNCICCNVCIRYKGWGGGVKNRQKNALRNMWTAPFQNWRRCTCIASWSRTRDHSCLWLHHVARINWLHCLPVGLFKNKCCCMFSKKLTIFLKTCLQRLARWAVAWQALNEMGAKMSGIKPKTETFCGNCAVWKWAKEGMSTFRVQPFTATWAISRSHCARESATAFYGIWPQCDFHLFPFKSARAPSCFNWMKLVDFYWKSTKLW